MAVHHSLELQNGACDEDGHQLRTGKNLIWDFVISLRSSLDSIRCLYSSSFRSSLDSYCFLSCFTYSFHLILILIFNAFWKKKIRPGTLWTCIAHIITAVIGSGVLSLAWSTAQLGWVAGPVSLLCFAVVTFWSAFLLSDCYRSPDPVTGSRNYTYMDAVRVNLGSIQEDPLFVIRFYCLALEYIGSTVAEIAVIALLGSVFLAYLI